jgi:hypothetical protein
VSTPLNEPPMMVRFAGPRPVICCPLAEWLNEALPVALALFESRNFEEELLGDVDNWKPQGVLSAVEAKS